MNINKVINIFFCSGIQLKLKRLQCNNNTTLTVLAK